jgi:hypothetical protein
MYLHRNLITDQKLEIKRLNKIVLFPVPADSQPSLPGIENKYAPAQ